MTQKEAIVFLDAIKRGLHQTGKDHPYRDDLIPKMKEALCIAIEEMKAEPCEDAISREDAIMCITGMYIVDLECKTEDVISRHIKGLMTLPSVTPKQKTGKWNVLGLDDLSDVDLYKCSECNLKIIRKFNYCPCCGAKMENPE